MNRRILGLLAALVAPTTFAQETAPPGASSDAEGVAPDGGLEDACTSILVSAGASADGSVMITYSADAAFMPRLLSVPGGRHAAGETCSSTVMVRTPSSKPGT